MNKDIRLKTLGLNIKIERLKKGFSQEELAKLAGVCTNYVSQIENGKPNPTILKVIDIAKALDIDMNQISKSV